MAIFGRKKDEDEDYEDDEGYNEEEVRNDRKLTRKFKDLNNSNRRKRKEPAKPWGKKERIFILVVIASTIIISAFLAFSSGPLELRFPKINFDSLNIFKEKTIIIKKQ